MTIYLLDINLLMALTDPMHVHHEPAHRWFATKGQRAWATCPLTENGFVRIASHPNYPSRPGNGPAVISILRQVSESPTTRSAGGSDFSAIGGKIQRHGSALIGASNTVEPWILVQNTRFENTQSPGHHFWAEDLSILEILEPDAIITHAQITDVYLLGLAVHNKGRLATLDRRIPVDAVRGGHQALELIVS